MIFVGEIVMIHCIDLLHFHKNKREINMYKKVSLSGLVLSALLAMNGCGGGGSSSDVSIDDTTKLVIFDFRCSSR